MRRITGISMVVIGILMVCTGIGELFIHPTDIPYHHIVMSALFVIAAGTHIWLNRKSILRYFSGLGWKWVLVVGSAGILFAIVNVALH
jgi:hypothetical protein